VCRVEYTPYNANTLSYGNKALQLHAYFQVTVVFLNKALHWKDLVQSHVKEQWCVRYVHFGRKGIMYVNVKGNLCARDVCSLWRALIQKAYLYVRNVSIVIIVHGDSAWMME